MGVYAVSSAAIFPWLIYIMAAGYACLLVLQSAMVTAGADVRGSSPDTKAKTTHIG